MSKPQHLPILLTDGIADLSEIIFKPNLHVITGGPGCGKTTLLRGLQKRGFPVIEEAARKIIQEQVEQNGTALPWCDVELYTQLMLARSIESFLDSNSDSEIFCDRGIPDTLCYACLIRLPEILEITRACERLRYNRRVFMLPPWPEIYHTDTERKQAFAEAVEVHRQMTSVYRDCDYEIIEVPRAEIEVRAEFVLSHLSLPI